MKLKPVLLLAASFLLPLAAQAQLGLYATFTASRMGGVQSSPYAISAADGGTRSTIDVSGGTFGAYYDFQRPYGPVRLGADLRGVFSHSSRGAGYTNVGAGSHLDSALGGVRASFNTPIHALQPYVQASAGLGRSDYGLVRDVRTGRAVLIDNLEYHLFAGADIHIVPLFDFRAVELGYGGIDPFGAAGHNYSLRSVTTGIVFHIPSLP